MNFGKPGKLHTLFSCVVCIEWKAKALLTHITESFPASPDETHVNIISVSRRTSHTLFISCLWVKHPAEPQPAIIPIILTIPRKDLWLRVFHSGLEFHIAASQTKRFRCLNECDICIPATHGNSSAFCAKGSVTPHLVTCDTSGPSGLVLTPNSGNPIAQFPSRPSLKKESSC